MRRFLLCFLLFSSTGLFAGGQQEQDPGVFLVVAAPRTISSMPLILLDDTVVGGRVVKVVLYDDHPLTLAEFLSGKYDVLMTGYQLGLGRWKADGSVKLLSVPVWGVSSLVVRDAALQGMASLAGKKVLVPFKGSPLEVQLLALLKMAGMEGQVAVEYAPITQMPALLLQGQADAVTLPEPLVSRLASQGQARPLFSFASEWGRFTGDPRSPQVGLFVRSNHSPFDAQAYLALKTRVGEVSEGVVNDADVAKLAQALEISPELVLQALGGTLFSQPTDAEQLNLLQTYHEKTADGMVVTEDFFHR